MSQATIMAPASDNNNQDLATKKAKLDSNTVINNVGEYFFFCFFIILQQKNKYKKI